jgi:hypothetical protein
MTEETDDTATDEWDWDFADDDLPQPDDGPSVEPEESSPVGSPIQAAFPGGTASDTPEIDYRIHGNDHAFNDLRDPSRRSITPAGPTDNANNLSTELDQPSVDQDSDNLLNISTDLVLAPALTIAAPLPNHSLQLLFQTDEKTVSSQLQRVEEKTLRRQQTRNNQIHQLSHQLAMLSARLAHEHINRDAALHTAWKTSLVERSHRLLDDLALLQDRDAVPVSSSQPWRQIHHRLEKLDTQMTQSMFVDLPNLQSSLSLDEAIDAWKADDRLAQHEADKCQRALVRRFEHWAGIVTQRRCENSAANHATLTLLSENVAKLSTEYLDDQPKMAEDLIQQIRNVRAALQEERATRKAQDEKLRMLIERRVNALKDAIVQVHGDNDY